jgi:hypothetical protein
VLFALFSTHMQFLVLFPWEPSFLTSI